MDGNRRAAEAMAQVERGAGADSGRRVVQADLKLFTWKVLIVAGVAVLAYLTMRVAEALLLIFAAALFAILLTRMTRAVRGWTGVRHGVAFALVLAGLVAVLAVGGWFIGAEVVAQYDQFSGQIGTAIERLPPQLREELARQGDPASWLSRLRPVAANVAFAVGDLVVVVFAAIYMAAAPDLYRRGLVLLVPPAGHARALQVLDVTGEALWKWLIGQFLSMAIVGLLTAAGLWALGVPAVAALGVLAAILEFIPFLGPILAAAPAVLIAFAQSPDLALWVAGLYLLVQQLEGHLIQPLMQKRVVDLPPVVTIGAIACGGLLGGLLGMFLATPLAVVAMVMVNMLYIEDKLGQGRHFPDKT
ncbi:AI-2E family transporter [Azospirillum sp.]|uniref:AI-2E family transporter n=1 Tax=Azospirillum sp. TaxID=34012 RepID=UPI003D721B5B